MKQGVVATVALGFMWLVATASGMSLIWDYEYSPGAPATAPDRWPTESRLARSPGRATLVMMAHPHCPCTRASVHELARVMARVKDRLTAHVVVVRPPDAPDGWEQTDLWRSAAEIPGVHVARDDDGVEMGRFGAMTSGQVVLYDASGRLLFAGGITASRGHEGDNAGRNAIVALLTGLDAVPRETPVFGCALTTPTS
jgi:hypothetical protein